MLMKQESTDLGLAVLIFVPQCFVVAHCFTVVSCRNFCFSMSRSPTDYSSVAEAGNATTHC